MTTDANRTAVSYILKNKLMSTLIPQPMMTIIGVTSKAICMLDPTETPSAKSIFEREKNE